MNRQPADFFRNFLAVSKEAGSMNWVRNRLAAMWWRWEEHRKSDVITTFNDRMLADIGLTRDQIGYGARAGPVAAPRGRKLKQLRLQPRIE
jgi:uncharacterized protein YjiS (DUF1127 family)